MRRAGLFLALVLPAASALAHGPGAFQVANPRVRIANGDGRVQVTLVNRKTDPVKIVGAYSPSAERAELRRRGNAVSAFEIAGKGELKLAPGGDEIVLTRLTRKLDPGNLVPVILRLDDGDTFAVMARVAK